jgi:hypothetical protein
MPSFSEPIADWAREVPRYRATRSVHPSPNSRHRLEPVFSQMSDSSCYQFAERPITAGEIVETKSWPHPSFHPLNRSAEKVLAFFNSAPKSRLGMSPWRGDRISLEDGLSGGAPPKFKIGATAA